jgi:hypothetical protein
VRFVLDWLRAQEELSCGTGREMSHTFAVTFDPLGNPRLERHHNKSLLPPAAVCDELFMRSGGRVEAMMDRVAALSDTVAGSERR